MHFTRSGFTFRKYYIYCFFLGLFETGSYSVTWADLELWQSHLTQVPRHGLLVLALSFAVLGTEFSAQSRWVLYRQTIPQPPSNPLRTGLNMWPSLVWSSQRSVIASWMLGLRRVPPRPAASPLFSYHLGQSLIAQAGLKLVIPLPQLPR